MATTTSSPSPRPFPFAPSPQSFTMIAAIGTSPSPSSSHHSTTSPTPPPRPPSSPGISVFAPRPMRVPMYRPQFSRPVFLYDTEKDTTDPKTGGSDQSSSAAGRRGSTSGVGGQERDDGSNKDAAEELYKIVRPGSASSSSSTQASSTTNAPNTSSPTAVFSRPMPVYPARSPPTHRRNPSDASDSGISSILGGLSALTTNVRMMDDNSDWRIPQSPVARRNVGNPMIRDPSFQLETPKRETRE